IDVLGGLLVAGEHTSAETDHPALFVANWKNQAPAKAIVVMIAAFFAQNEAAFFDEFQFMALASCPVDGVVPKVRSCANPEELHRFTRNASFSQVLARELA